MVDFGEQPVACHFIPTPDAPFATGELALAVCGSCGVIQLNPPFPSDLLTPPYDWVTYREPEDHLDDVVARIGEMSLISERTCVYGLSFKDASTLDRLSALGAGRTVMIDPVEDLGAAKRSAGVEIVQALLCDSAVEPVVGRNGLADIVIARHILEHAARPARFLDAIEKLLRPDGLLVIEVPDCARSIALNDFIMLWEDHCLYFTEETLPQALADRGFRILLIERHAYAFEDVLLLYAQQCGSADNAHPTARSAAVRSSRRKAEGFAAAFGRETERLDRILRGLAADGGGAVYGAGHLTCAFISLHRLAAHFAFVVDDTPQKQGLYLPGVGLEIVPRDRLLDSNVATCLLGLSPEIEDKVIANNAAFVEKGGRFFSLLAASPRSVRKLDTA